MLALLVLTAGFVAAGAALGLARIDRRRAGGTGNPMGDALATFFAWIAVFGLATFGLYRFGILVTGGIAVLTLAGSRLIGRTETGRAVVDWKLALAVLALLLAVAVVLQLLGALSEMRAPSRPASGPADQAV